MDWVDQYEKFHEELRIDFICPGATGKAIDINQDPLTIHKIASSEYDPDDLLCWGLTLEREIYERNSFYTANSIIEIEYYGTDYHDEPGDPESGHYRILKTPRKWISEKPIEESNSNITHEEIIQRGEGKYIEFKPALVYNFTTGEPGIGVKYKVAQAIAAFLNTDGGLLYIGVTNDGEIQGLEYDYSILKGNKKDKVKLEFDQLTRHFFQPFVTNYIQTQIIEIKGKEVYVIRIYPSKQPVFLKNKRGDKIIKEFYRRTEASSLPIEDIEEIIKYVFNNDNLRPRNDV